MSCDVNMIESPPPQLKCSVTIFCSETFHFNVFKKEALFIFIVKKMLSDPLM